MTKHVMIAILLGIVYWLLGFILMPNEILYGILTLAIIPNIIGAILAFSFKYKVNISNLAICAVTVVMVRQTLIILRIMVIFLYDKSLLSYVKHALIASFYTVPFQILFVITGCALMVRLMHMWIARSL